MFGLKRSINLTFPNILKMSLSLLPVSVLVSFMFASGWDNLANTDFMTFWLAGKSIVQGFEPYDPEQWFYWQEAYGVTWFFNPRFIYPLPLRVFLAPLGLISLYPAYILWVTAALVIIAFSLLWLQKQGKQEFSIFEFFLLVTAVFSFRPTLTSLKYGQIGYWILAAITATIYLWNKKRWLIGGLVLSLTVLKPTIGGPYLLLTIPWILLIKQWRAILGMLLGGAGLFIVGILDNPNWVSIFLQSGNVKMGNTFGYAPNFWGLSRLITDGRAVIPGGAILSIISIGLGVYVMNKNQEGFTPFAFFSLITPIVVMTTPYLWAYDQLYLLIPVSYVSLRIDKISRFSIFGVLSFLAAAVLSYLLVLPALQLNFDYISGLLPLAVFTAYLLLLDSSIL